MCCVDLILKAGDYDGLEILDVVVELAAEAGVVALELFEAFGYVQVLKRLETGLDGAHPVLQGEDVTEDLREGDLGRVNGKVVVLYGVDGGLEVSDVLAVKFLESLHGSLDGGHVLGQAGQELHLILELLVKLVDPAVDLLDVGGHFRELAPELVEHAVDAVNLHVELGLDCGEAGLQGVDPEVDPAYVVDECVVVVIYPLRELVDLGKVGLVSLGDQVLELHLVVLDLVGQGVDADAVGLVTVLDHAVEVVHLVGELGDLLVDPCDALLNVHAAGVDGVIELLLELLDGSEKLLLHIGDLVDSVVDASVEPVLLLGELGVDLGDVALYGLDVVVDQVDLLLETLVHILQVAHVSVQNVDQVVGVADRFIHVL